jgi:hypothetical protein
VVCELRIVNYEYRICDGKQEINREGSISTSDKEH